MAQRGNTWELPIGDSQTYQITIFSGSNPPAALTGQYAGTETLTPYVWEGSSSAVDAGVLTPAWISGTGGTTSCVVNGGATASLAAGFYRIRLDVTYGGQQSPYYYGWLSLLPTPGSTVDPPTYCAFTDLADKAGDWLPALQQKTGESNFAYERGRARSWLDEIIVGRSRVYAYMFDLNYATIYGSFPFGPVESPDSVMTGYLAANDLIVRPRTIEVVAYKALAYICEKRMMFDEDSKAYEIRADWYHRKASQALRGYRCEVDINADGKPDIAFNMGVFMFR